MAMRLSYETDSLVITVMQNRICEQEFGHISLKIVHS